MTTTRVPIVNLTLLCANAVIDQANQLLEEQDIHEAQLRLETLRAFASWCDASTHTIRVSIFPHANFTYN